MKTVQITSGGYGYREKAGSPTRLIRAGEFVCLPDDEADRLAALGVAVCQPEAQPDRAAEKRPGDKAHQKEQSGHRVKKGGGAHDRFS